MSKKSRMSNALLYLVAPAVSISLGLYLIILGDLFLGLSISAIGPVVAVISKTVFKGKIKPRENVRNVMISQKSCPKCGNLVYDKDAKSCPKCRYKLKLTSSPRA